ncbi:MAG: copper amine oxidase N-terminal domain-containing protein [Clostridia bacterium]|nr:copper amine oxidase N-terminal domain-containing protein [Clostridia bacterium]
MKNTKFIAALAALTISAAPFSAFAANDDITVTVNDEVLSFDVMPQIIDDRTVMPMRAIFEALGADVSWDGETRTVTAVKDDTTIKMTIGSNVMYVNDMPIELDVAPLIIDERTLVPGRAVAESLGADVSWDGETRTVIIKSMIERAAEAALTKLKEKIKEIGVYSESEGAYSLTVPSVKATYSEKDDSIYIVYDKNILLIGDLTIKLGIASDGIPKLDAQITALGKTLYSMNGEFINGHFSVIGSDMPESTYETAITEIGGFISLLNGFLDSNLGITTEDLGISAN